MGFEPCADSVSLPFFRTLHSEGLKQRSLNLIAQLLRVKVKLIEKVLRQR